MWLLTEFISMDFSFEKLKRMPEYNQTNQIMSQISCIQQREVKRRAKSS